jgi:hypothetical protein
MPALIFRFAGVILAAPWGGSQTDARAACMIGMVREERCSVAPSAPRIATRVGSFEPQ